MDKTRDARVSHNQPPKASPSGTDSQAKSDADGQFERRSSGSNPTRNPDGLHSAKPVVTSGNGDATQPIKRNEKAG